MTTTHYPFSRPLGLRWMRRAVCFFTMALGVFAAPGLRAAPLHEVMVYSYVTAYGRAQGAPNEERPAFCVLAPTAARDFGQPMAESHPADPESVRRQLLRALRKNFYRDAEAIPPAGNVIVVCHWGCLRPLVLDAGLPGEKFVNEHEMLAVLGAKALERAMLSERTGFLAAAREERYYMIVSAYDAAGSVPPQSTQLLWRTHLSVPALRLSQTQAVPLLCAAGAALFGRETPAIRRIVIAVSGTLVPGADGP